MNKAVTFSEIQPFIDELLKSGKSFSFMPNGISMLPLIREGKDSVVISPVPPILKKYDLILYRRDNGQFVLHRIVKVKNCIYTLCGDNQLGYEHNITKSMIIGLATSVIRDGVEITNNNHKYKKYLRNLYFKRIIKRIIKVTKQKIKHFL